MTVPNVYSAITRSPKSQRTEPALPRQTRILGSKARRRDRKPNSVRAYLTSDMKTASGKRTQLSALRIAARTLNDNPQSDPLRLAWHRLTFQRVARLQERLLELGYAVPTVNRILGAVRGVLRSAWRLGLMSADAFARATDLKRVRGSAALAGRVLDTDEISALYGCCRADAGPRGARDGAAIALLHAAGLRRREAASLPAGAINLESGEVEVTGKGRKHRVTYLGDGLPWVKDWLDWRGGEPGPLLHEVRAGRVVHRVRPLSAEAIWNVVHRRAKAAGLERITPHDLRRTFATRLLEAGDVLLVQKLLGHESADTTGRYDRRDLAKMRELQGRLRVPRPGGRT